MKQLRILAIALSLLILLTMLVGCASPKSIFTDKNLEAAIRDALSKPAGEKITEEELATITELYVESTTAHIRINNLKGLEHLVNLTSLSLRIVKQECDFLPLANLTNLTQLFIEGEGYTMGGFLGLEQKHGEGDISPLAGLTNLTELHVVYAEIKDLSPLANLTSLTTLDLSKNYKIIDISPLANLTNLTTLNLALSGHMAGSFTRLSDLSPLANLTNLITLNIADNDLSDLSPLANLTNLTTLDLGWNDLSDLSPLANLTNLNLLYLDGNRLSDISPLLENSGLGEGDEVWLGNYGQGFWESEEATEAIKALRDKGVRVHTFR